MSDLVYRLRQGSLFDIDDMDATCNEAADEIEKLRAALQAVMNDLEIIVESGGLSAGFLEDIVYTNARAALEDKQ